MKLAKKSLRNLQNDKKLVALATGSAVTTNESFQWITMLCEKVKEKK